MKLTVNGREIPAQVVDENGTPTGYAPVYQVLQAYGIPVRLGGSGEFLLGIRRFAEALDRPHRYDVTDHHFLIDSPPPVPPLPAEPVGAGVPPWLPVTPVIASGPGDRRPELLEAVLRQFRVAENYRYQPNRQGQDETYCNIYLWDCTRALGAEIPHWVNGRGEPAGPARGHELDANATIDWLRRLGPTYGWRSVRSAQAALERANQGYPVVATWYNPGGIGHVAMVRPGRPDPNRGIPIAQAGAVNGDSMYLADGFGSRAPIEFWTHD
ncbi:MAG: hypothetical protein ACOY93_08400 [Bacillota bacterium]